MLLRNESSLKFSCFLSLTFDDGVTREAELNVDDIVHLAYRYNGERFVVKGRITNIQPIIHSSIITPQKTACYCHPNSNPSAVLTIDSSINYNRNVVKVRMEDILDCVKLSSLDTDRLPDPGDTSGSGSTGGSSDSGNTGSSDSGNTGSGCGCTGNGGCNCNKDDNNDSDSSGSNNDKCNSHKENNSFCGMIVDIVEKDEGGQL